MNGMINKLQALIITMFAIAISGCTPPQNITREYFGEDSLHVAKSEAASILLGERMTRLTFFLRIDYTIVSVNEKQLIVESTLYSDSGKLLFENVRKIELESGSIITLHFEGSPDFMIRCGNKRQRNRLLLAFLVLCPNIE